MSSNPVACLQGPCRYQQGILGQKTRHLTSNVWFLMHVHYQDESPVYSLLIIFYVLIWQILFSTYHGQRKKLWVTKSWIKTDTIISIRKLTNMKQQWCKCCEGDKWGSESLDEGSWSKSGGQGRIPWRCAAITLWRGDRDESVLDRRDIMCQVAMTMWEI